LIAVELIEHALEYTAVYDPRCIELQDHLVSAYFLLGRLDEAKELARVILLGTVDHHRIGQATWLLGRIAMCQGDEEEMERIAALSEPRLGPVWQARIRGLQAEIVFALGRQEEAFRRSSKYWPRQSGSVMRWPRYGRCTSSRLLAIGAMSWWRCWLRSTGRCASPETTPS
jgi:hypothetical protein